MVETPDQRRDNPFTPTFGVTPPVLVGRAAELAELAGALDASIGDPYRAVMVTGQRGSGKTVFLNQVEDLARGRGWAVISETARPRLVERLTETVLPAMLDQLDPAAVTSSTTGGSLGIGVASASISRELSHRYQPQPDLRGLLTPLADLMRDRDAGVLVSIDELNRKAVEDLQVITQVVQHCFREGRAVAFIGAGLPLESRALLDEPGTTFLRRAERIVLGPVSDADARRGLADPLRTWGRAITADALDLAVAGTKGYPFLLQAIGHRLWSTSTPDQPIAASAATEAVEYATGRVGDLVMAPELRGLSPVDRAYLDAMAVDPGPSRTREVADRMGVSPAYANTYRSRLLQAGIVVSVGHGLVDFALPALRGYLREQAPVNPAAEP